MSLRVALWCVWSLVFALWPVAQARASCVAPEPRILWSYPAAGATDVPIDADFFVILDTYGERPRVEVNGAPFASWDGRQFDLGTLEANTEHVVRVTVGFAPNDTVLETRFTTGTGTAPGVALPTLPSYTVDSLSHPMTAHTCSTLLFAVDCFDGGEDSVVRLMPTGEATLWFVETTGPGADGGGQPILAAWPGECGPPPIVMHRDRIGVDHPCVRITSVDASGERRSSGELCFDPPATSGDQGGCAIGATSDHEHAAGWLGMLAVVATLRRRRARRG